MTEQAEQFIDTNVLVYAFDHTNPKKHLSCRQLLEKLLIKGGVVSNQVLAELFYVLSRKLPKPMGTEGALRAVNALAESPTLRRVDYGTNTVKKAATLCFKTGAGFWDALIAETMLENGVQTICTENEKDFKKIPGVRVSNPFK